MSKRRKLREQYYSRRAQKIHARKVKRKNKKFIPVFLPPAPIFKKKKKSHNTYYDPGRLHGTQFSPIINYLYSVKRKLSRKYNTSAFFKNKISISVPKHFSLVDNCSESYKFIFNIFFTLYDQKYEKLVISYKNCEALDLDAQVLMDVVLKEFIDHYKAINRTQRKIRWTSISLSHTDEPHVKKILYSIGSFNIHRNAVVVVPHLIPYHLCIGAKSTPENGFDGSEKEVHVTQLIDYIQGCLATLNKRLTVDARSELCEVIGEILINSEEHSTISNRYSIGYFEDFSDEESQKKGIFNLVIFNFGKSIYEKFKDSKEAPTHIVQRMTELSSLYTKKSFFHESFKEETLWTLYSLQEGITSIADKKRGNGSIRFIDSFFKLKGVDAEMDDISKLTIISGNTKITFNGEYKIHKINKNGNNFNIMAFNKNNNIEEKPDKKYVTFADHYFPGTMIVAKICISEDDLEVNKVSR